MKSEKSRYRIVKYCFVDCSRDYFVVEKRGKGIFSSLWSSVDYNGNTSSKAKLFKYLPEAKQFVELLEGRELIRKIVIK